MSGTPIGNLVGKERKRLGWTLQSLADECARSGWPVTPQALNDIEMGRTRVPRGGLLRVLAALFGKDFDELVRAVYSTPQGVAS
jgi:transcriptional regulator with XRE-family HTH domain